jgi:hypothetical protein
VGEEGKEKKQETEGLSSLSKRPGQYLRWCHLGFGYVQDPEVSLGRPPEVQTECGTLLN